MLILSSDDHSELRTGHPRDRAVDLSDPATRRALSPAALRGFFNIAREWGLDERQMRSLLGGIASSTLHACPSRLERSSQLGKLSLENGLRSISSSMVHRATRRKGPDLWLLSSAGCFVQRGQVIGVRRVHEITQTSTVRQSSARESSLR